MKITGGCLRDIMPRLPGGTSNTPSAKQPAASAGAPGTGNSSHRRCITDTGACSEVIRKLKGRPMKIFMSSAVAEQLTAHVRQALAAFGHDVVLSADGSCEPSHCEVTIALVSAQPDADSLLRTWEQVDLAIDSGIPVLAVSLTTGRDLPAAVA